MKTTFTSLLLVDRLLNSLFTFTFLLLTAAVSAQTVNTNTLYTANSKEAVSAGIEYTSLTATASDKAVFINWVTAAEQNNSHFEVERSLDCKAFQTVALVLDGFTAAGTGKSYKFKEAAALNKAKTVYYRLKQVGTDNQVSYSSVLAIQRNTTITVFPKQDFSNLRSNKHCSKALAIADIVVVVNPNGQILLSKQSDMGFKNVSAEKVQISAGIFNAQVLANGTWFIKPKPLFA